MQAPSNRTRLRRMNEKAAYDFDTIHAILDGQPLAHIGHLMDGMPNVIPTLQWREGNRVLWHGASTSRMIKAALAGPVCLSVTSVDGLVLARSGLEHSVNFRSVMVFGQPEAITDPAEKTRLLQLMFDQMLPDRWPQLRPMTAQELKATAVLSLPITEASAKIGKGMPTDAPEDMDWPIWAGIVPMSVTRGRPKPDCETPKGPPPRIRRF